MMSRSTFLTRALTLSLLTGLAACEGEVIPVAPSGPEALEFSRSTVDAGVRTDGRNSYPLQLGNLWKYRADVVVRTQPDEGEPTEERVVRTTKNEITGAALLDGLCYTVEEQTISEDISPGETYTQTVYYRQDVAGLYEANRSADGGANPPLPPTLTSRLAAGAISPAWARALRQLESRVQALRDARGGPLEGELTRLVYPLHPGQHWVIVDDAFRLTATVEGRENLRLSTGTTPAWRIRLESDLFGPEDVVRVFYGRDGYLGWRAFVVGEVTSDDGERIGTVHFTDVEYLQEIEVDRRAELPCDAAPQVRKPRVQASS